MSGGSDYCCALGCKTYRKQKVAKEKQLSFHRFPLKKPDLLEKWIAAVGREQSWRPTYTSCLCSTHFTEDSFSGPPNHNGRRLNPTAVPTIFTSTIIADCEISASQTERKEVQECTSSLCSIGDESENDAIVSVMI